MRLVERRWWRVAAVFTYLLLIQCLEAANIDQEDIQRLKDQIVVESGLEEQFVRLLTPPTVNEVRLEALSPQDLIRPPNAPVISALDVECGSGEMHINIEFDRPFNGIIYSKGYFSSAACHHVLGGSRRTYKFGIRVGDCGTRLNHNRDGQKYIENVVVVQNDIGLQKAFDSARKIRCMTRAPEARRVDEKIVSYAFNVDKLDQKEVTFQTEGGSMPTANAVLDIQMGQGPYAPSVDGLVKIGDILTMVVEAEGGDADVDVRVRQCIAMNGDRTSHVNLTDDVGCTMKPSLLSPWLKTKRGSGVMAYSYFSAFKFPEQMDVIIECNLDVCRGNCGFCEEDQNTVSRLVSRSRRELTTAQLAAAGGRPNSTSAFAAPSRAAPVRLARRLRVVSPQDIALTEANRSILPVEAGVGMYETVCLSVLTFVVGLVVILLLLFVASIATAVLCVRARGQNTALVTVPDSSFHAFSSISGKP